MTTKTAETATPSLEVAELDIQRLPLSDVSPHPKNARIHTPEQIKAIQESYRLDQYIAGSMCIQKSTKTLYKGHAVYEALYGLGVQEADFVVKDLTDAETLALLARDNALSDMSTNDPVKLKSIQVELVEMNVPIQRMGYTLKEITSMQPRKPVVEDDPPTVSEEEPVTRTGDLWALGNHRLLCGDSTKAEDVERVMGGEKADMVFTDPPYGVNYKYEGTKDDPTLYPEFAGKIYSLIERLGIPTLITVGHRWNNLWFQFEPDGFLIWFDKTKQSPSAFAHLLKCELMLIFGKFPERFRWDIIEVQQPRGDGLRELHSCPKPMALYADILEQQPSLRNILDLFLGSGTTLIAADQLGRICYGIEIDKRYINHVGSDEHVTVERKGKTLTWKQAQLPKVV
jgi:DNA modification methylase